MLLTTLLFRWWFRPGGNSSLDGTSVMIFIAVASSFFFLLWVYQWLMSREIQPAKAARYLEPLSKARLTILQEKCYYYGQLLKKDRERFESRVNNFLINKMFTSENGYPVTDEMKVLIAAAAVQITFGLKPVFNSHFNHILVMPNAGMEPKTATKSTIVIPWSEFLDGFSNPHDGINEGLKIIATAIRMDDRMQATSYRWFSRKSDQKWLNVSEAEASNFMSGMFQHSGMSPEQEKDEYFAHCVVYFFELPIAFRQKYPALYEAMVNLLGQDPVAKSVRK